MDNMQRQMDMFEEGGLRDEGGMVDEESGNEVPIGSTRKEVRDDIPAQISEGEFVFPADVVRFLGLEKLMEMRQAAKMGLKQMEAMGQMGNSDEATIPDDMPFGMADLVVISGPDEDDEPQKKAQGGLLLQSGGSIRMPDFDFSNQDVRIYVKEGSPDRRIPFFDGEPVIPIPAGYVLKGSAPVKEETETEKAIPTDDDDGSTPPPQTEFQKAGGWSMDFGNPPDSNKVDLWINEAKKTTGNTPAVMTSVAAIFGGLPAAFVYGANKLNAKGRDANLQRAIEAAKKTPKEGQVAALNEISTDIEKGADKTLLGKLGNAIKSLFGVSDEEAQKAQEIGINADAGLSTPNLEEEEDDVTPTGVTPTGDVSQQMLEAGLTGDDEVPPVNTLQENLNELGIDPDDLAGLGYTGGDIDPSDPADIKAIVDPYPDVSSYDVKKAAFDIAMQRAAKDNELKNAGYTGGDIDPSDPSDIASDDIADISKQMLEAGYTGREDAPFVTRKSKNYVKRPGKSDTLEVLAGLGYTGGDIDPSDPADIKAKYTRGYADLLKSISLNEITLEQALTRISPNAAKALQRDTIEQELGFTDAPSKPVGRARARTSVSNALIDGDRSPRGDTSASNDPPPPTTPTPSGGGNDDGPDFGDRDRPNLSNVGNLQGQSTEEKTKAVALKTDNLSPTEKTGGAALDTAMGISGLSRGGLAGRRKKK
jgi:hypothetical protein